MELLGCTLEEFKSHIEKQFDDKMTWENYGAYWHVDHIIPCASFDLTKEDDQRRCFHYTNMQPLEAHANMRKGAKMPDQKIDDDILTGINNLFI